LKRVLFVVVAVSVAWGTGVLLGPAGREPGEGTLPSQVDTANIATPAPREPVPPVLMDGSRRPVLLVPGWLNTERDMAALRIRFVAAGWPSASVRAVTFDDPAGSNRDHALELEAVVRGLLRQTGASEIDIVAYSMGGLATRWYLHHGQAPPVRRVAFLASPHRGTLAAHLAWGPSREEMIPESAFLQELNALSPLPAGVEALTVRTSIDTHVLPAESATLPGVPDREVCCPTHSGVLNHQEVFIIVRRFLEQGHAGG